MWKDLSLKDKSALMQIMVNNGIYDLSTIRDTYNKFAEGGKKGPNGNWTMQDEVNYRAWRNKLPDNLKYTDDSEYDMRGAYKAGMTPQYIKEDNRYHLGSRDPQSGKILKAPHHPTFLKALITDASMGYYPSTDNKGNTYTTTWIGNKFDEGGYVREQNNNPISFDEEGNLTDQVTGEKGTMMLPEVTVRGVSPETRARNYSSAYDRYALPDLINWGLEGTIGKALQPVIEEYPWSANVLKAMTPSSYIGTLREGKAPWDLSNTGFGDSKDMQSANLLFDLAVGLKGVKGINKGVNTASRFIGKKYVAPYVASKTLNRSINANPKGQILVSDSYFNSPNNWYRISNTPEVYGIKEIGKNVTTRDSGALIDVPSDNWRTSVLEQPLIRDKEGFLALDPQKDFVEFSGWDNFNADKLNFSPRLFQKSGSAHGNTTQASKGQVWQGGISNSSMFPTVILEGQAARQVPMGITRSRFRLSPWEDIPIGQRIGFHTGEMPIDNLGYFLDLKNGKYSYQGQIIPDKRIDITPKINISPEEVNVQYTKKYPKYLDESGESIVYDDGSYVIK